MSDDLPAVSDGKTEKTLEMPTGKSLIHERADGPEIWRLCCRLRLDMRQDGLAIKDAHATLLMAYPDLEITAKQLRVFMEDYVDPAVIVEPSFWKKGLMRAQASLNTAVEISAVAQRMQDKWEEVEEKVGTPDGVPLKDWLAAGKKVAEARRIQAQELERVGFGPQPKEHAMPVQQPTMPVQVNVERATFNLSEAMGGSFGRKPAPTVVDIPHKPASSPP